MEKNTVNFNASSVICGDDKLEIDYLCVLIACKFLSFKLKHMKNMLYKLIYLFEPGPSLLVFDVN